MDIYMKRVTLTPNGPNSSYPDPLFGGMPGLELSRNIFIDSTGSWGQLAPQSVQCQRRWTPPRGINSTTWDFSLRPCLTQKPLVMIWGCKDQIWRSDLAYVCQQQLWGKISQPDGFAELIFECRPVCWSTVYLEKPLGPGKKVPWILASRCTPASDRGAIQLLKCQYYLKCLWVSPWYSFSSPGRQGTPMSHGTKVTLKPSAKSQTAPDALPQTAERSPTSSGQRVMCRSQGKLGSWGCLKSANSLQLSAQCFYVTPRAAPQAWIHREFLTIISHLPRMQRYFQLSPPAACILPAARKEAPAEVSTEVVF